MPSDTKTLVKPLVGVIGLGLMGRGIVTCLLSRGFHVIAFGLTESERDEAQGHISHALAEMEQRVSGACDAITNWSGRYQPTGDLKAMKPCEFIIESIVEDLQIKKEVFDQLEQIVGETVPIASNTSALPISVLQQARRYPERFVGMHWGEPAHIMRFLEIIRGEQTSDAVFDATAVLARQLGKEPSLIQKDVRGFVTNRLMYAMLREAFGLLESGVADVETIDRSFRNDMGWWAMLAGPFRFMDLTGIPAYASVMRELLPELSNQQTVPQTLAEMVERGAKGIANQDGFYDYTPEEAQQWADKWESFTWDIRQLAEKHLPVEASE